MTVWSGRKPAETSGDDLRQEARAMSKKFLDEIFEKEVVKLPEEDREPYRAARSLADHRQQLLDRALRRACR